MQDNLTYTGTNWNNLETTIALDKTRSEEKRQTAERCTN